MMCLSYILMIPNVMTLNLAQNERIFPSHRLVCNLLYKVCTFSENESDPRLNIVCFYVFHKSEVKQKLFCLLDWCKYIYHDSKLLMSHKSLIAQETDTNDQLLLWIFLEMLLCNGDPIFSIVFH